jgi:hypothetical protein
MGHRVGVVASVGKACAPKTLVHQEQGYVACHCRRVQCAVKSSHVK